MSTEWTIERLDALLEGTVIDVEWSTMVERLLKPSPGKWWATNLGDRPEDCDTSSEDLADNPHVKSITVVSVPLDALLSGEAIEAATDAFVMATNLAGTLGDGAKQAIRAAIAHVTGGES